MLYYYIHHYYVATAVAVAVAIAIAIASAVTITTTTTTTTTTTPIIIHYYYYYAGAAGEFRRHFWGRAQASVGPSKKWAQRLREEDLKTAGKGSETAENARYGFQTAG